MAGELEDVSFGRTLPLGAQCRDETRAALQQHRTRRQTQNTTRAANLEGLDVSERPIISLLR